MWKLVLGFIVFAALAMFVIIQGGESIHMSGESHSVETHEEAHEQKPAAAEPAK